ncbi:hypothetical protein [Streptomyces sp. NRRL S-337]|uniref:hypothetical protein n=1 Tax=Streptomyces sp. NRRL S-337 TaxID=1463900 RepID=UPI00131AAC0B|nr:hypothetical protein [Streptomyces sp. NRRL S-337]
MSADTKSYDYLWTTERTDWVLIKTSRTVVPVIYNRSSRRVLLIEDNDVHAAVVAKMKGVGIEVFDSIPQ